MMSVAKKSFKAHFPKITFGSNISALLDALGESFERLRVFLGNVLTESNPSTAVDTLQEWYEQLGIKYDSSQSTENLQKVVSANYSNINLPTPDYISEKITTTFPNITIEETENYKETQCGSAQCGSAYCGSEKQFFYYIVSGSVDSEDQLSQLKALLKRIVPEHLVPIYNVTIEDDE
ncbi:MAG: DUF2313 domain-containing protein [Spirochaetales bacterium]|nr:DUF2313 domain-containing protein [Spirochaetales bacterium]